METVSLMEANPEEPTSLDELSAAVALSRRQLDRLFQKHPHCAATRDDLERQLNKARQLLLQTAISRVNVTLACSFISATHFNKCYRDD
ncbi:MAG: transcriptional regulator GlxA family with amidase domain [Gammaproteobacteria bacterium]|jgi:transcriptional regulator GlxA family with amidase domain